MAKIKKSGNLHCLIFLWELVLVVVEVVHEGSNVVVESCTLLADPLSDGVLTTGDHVSDISFVSRPPEVTGVISAGIENDIEHFCRIRVAAVFYTVSVDISFTNDASGVEAVEFEEVTYGIRVRRSAPGMCRSGCQRSERSFPENQ